MKILKDRYFGLAATAAILAVIIAVATQISAQHWIPTPMYHQDFNKQLQGVLMKY
jgi:hypothetical protein